jgi:hypothetical protein
MEQLPEYVDANSLGTLPFVMQYAGALVEDH